MRALGQSCLQAQSLGANSWVAAEFPIETVSAQAPVCRAQGSTRLKRSQVARLSRYVDDRRVSRRSWP